MTESRFYYTNRDDPDAPVVLDDYDGLRPGARVVHVGPLPLPGVFTLIELVGFGDHVEAHLQDVEDGDYYLCDAANLAADAVTP